MNFNYTAKKNQSIHCQWSKAKGILSYLHINFKPTKTIIFKTYWSTRTRKNNNAITIVRGLHWKCETIFYHPRRDRPKSAFLCSFRNQREKKVKRSYKICKKMSMIMLLESLLFALYYILHQDWTWNDVRNGKLRETTYLRSLGA